MVNEVTYSQLAKIAQEQGKNVAEVAKEKGISEAQLADMKLQEAKFNGNPGAPEDTAQYSVKYDLNINGVKGVLSLENLKFTNGKVELSDEAKIMLNEFGVKGLVLQDGIVYAQHKDGQNYPVGDVSEQLDIDMAYADAQAEKQEQQDKYNANRRIGSSAWEMIKGAVAGIVATTNPVLGGAAAVGALSASCAGDDVPKVGGTNVADFSTNVNLTVYIPIKLPSTDYTPFFKKIIDELDGLKNDQAANLKLVINGINALWQQTQATAGDIEAILNNLRKVINNQEEQINITTKNGEDMKAYAEKLMKILTEMKSIMNDTELTVNERTARITALLDELGGQVKNLEEISADTNQTVHDIYEKIEKLKIIFDDTKILEAIDNLAKKGDKANELLELIYETMTSLGVDMTDMKTYIGDLIKLAVENNANLDDLKKLVLELNKNVKANGEQAHDDAKTILAAIKKLGVDVSADLAAILNAINSLPASQQKDYSEALKAILDKINQGNAENNANFKAVLDAIKDLGAKVTVGMNAILEGIKGQPNYTELLQKILAKIEENKNEVSSNGRTLKQILEQIKDLQGMLSITIVNGRVQVDCNCGDCKGGKHEGIIGDLNELLG